MKQKLFGHSAFRIVTLAFMAAVPMFAQIQQIIQPLTTIETTAIAAMRLFGILFLIFGAFRMFKGHIDGFIEALIAIAVGLGAQNIVTTVFPG